jgi:hypothetical protein
MIRKLCEILESQQNKHTFDDLIFLATNNYPPGKNQFYPKAHCALFCKEKTANNSSTTNPIGRLSLGMKSPNIGGCHA